MFAITESTQDILFMSYWICVVAVLILLTLVPRDYIAGMKHPYITLFTAIFIIPMIIIPWILITMLFPLKQKTKLPPVKPRPILSRIPSQLTEEQINKFFWIEDTRGIPKDGSVVVGLYGTVAYRIKFLPKTGLWCTVDYRPNVLLPTPDKWRVPIEDM